MDREIVTIPPDLFFDLKMTWDIDWRGQSSGESNTGVTQTVYNAFPRWVGSPEVMLHGSDIARWRSIRGQAQGRIGIYRVTLYDPVGFDIINPYPTGIPFSNGQPFSSGYGFEYEPFAVAVNAAAKGDVSIRVDVSAVGVAPKAGQIMSHDNWPFLVVSVTPVSTDVYDLKIQMPLRATIVSGDLILMRGTGLFEAVEDSMGNPAYMTGQTSAIGLSFREVLNR